MAYNPVQIGQKTMANSSPVTIASDQTGVPVAGNQTATQTASWSSATALNAAVSLNIMGFNTVSLGLIATSTLTAGAVTFEVSFDNTNWFPIQMGRIDSYNVESVYTLVASTSKAWTASVDAFNYFRVRLSTAITGTATVGVAFVGQTLPIESIVSVGQATASLLNATATLAPATSGGLSAATGSIAATKTDIKTTAGQVYGWFFYNPNATVAYVQVFNATAANVTLGTTAPVYSLPIPAGAGANVLFETGIAHATAISIAVTTTRAGSTGPGSTVDYNVFYK